MPEQPRLGGGSRCRPASSKSGGRDRRYKQVGILNYTVPVAPNGSVGPARVRTLVIACNRPVPVLVTVHGRGDAIQVVDKVLDLGLGDHFLPFQDAAEQQADDPQYDS